MMKKLIALALFAVAPVTLVAQELNYSFVEGGYYRTDISGLPDADGWGVGASAALGSNFHMFGNWSNQEFDHSSVDFDSYRVGFGYRHGLSDRTDLVARLSYERVDFGYGIDAEGYTAEVGLRASLAPKFEGSIFAGYADGKDASGDFFARVGAQYKFSSRWGLSADATFEDSVNTIFVGPRFSF